MLRENKILAVVSPAHAINIFQALDLVFFRTLKKLNQTARGNFGDDSVNDQIAKLVQAYE
jgi:hypothetical protein